LAFTCDTTTSLFRDLLHEAIILQVFEYVPYEPAGSGVVVLWSTLCTFCIAIPVCKGTNANTTIEVDAAGDGG